MPNGDPNFATTQLPELEAFFAAIATDLEAFASRRQLRIDRYYHQSHSWRFNFDHPVAGEACIELRRLMANLVEIHLIWWNVYGKRPRFERTGAFAIDSEFVTRLENALDEIRKWRLADLHPVAG